MNSSKPTLFLLLCFLFLAACSPATTNINQAPAGDVPSSPTAESTASEENTEAEPSDITFTDASGKELNFSTPPERLVFAGRASQLLIHTAYLFPEAIDRVAGMEQRAQRKTSMLPLIDPKYEQKTQFERDAAAEQIAPVQPDAVLMKTYMTERLGNPLEQLDIPVVYLDLETPEQFFRDLESLGALFDNPERTEEVKSFYQDRMDRVETALTGLKLEDRPSVLLIQYDTRSGEVAFNVPSANWLQTQLVELAGGEPIWTEAVTSGGWTVVNFEQIAAWDPDLIIVVNYFDDPGIAVAELRQDSKWKELRATQEDNILAFPGDYLSWDQPDTRWILGLQWLAKKIQADRFESLNLLDEVKTFYEEMYGLDAETFEAEVLPLITGDLDV
ncbi:ABC transporter substrate-binding protein [Chloroflexota bacterium]